MTFEQAGPKSLRLLCLEPPSTEVEEQENHQFGLFTCGITKDLERYRSESPAAHHRLCDSRLKACLEAKGGQFEQFAWIL